MMDTTFGGTTRFDGYADGGEPYTDEEMELMDAEERAEHGAITAFFEDLAETRELRDWQIGGVTVGSTLRSLRAVTKGARIGDALAVCEDCPLVAVAKLRAHNEHGDAKRARVSLGSSVEKLAKACNISEGFAEDIMYAADAYMMTDEDGERVQIYSQDLRDRLLRTVGIIEA